MKLAIDTSPIITTYPLQLNEKGLVVSDPTACSSGDDNTQAEYTIEYIEDKSQLKELTLLMNSLLEMRYSPYVYEYILKTGASSFSYLVRDKKGRAVAGMGCRLERSKSDSFKHSQEGLHLDAINQNLPEALDLCCMMLGVLSDHRRKGIASWMLRHACHNAQYFRGTDGQYISNFYLHVQTSNDTAKLFYESVGFDHVHTIDNYYKRLQPSSCYLLAYQVHTPQSYFQQQQDFASQQKVI